MRIAPILIGCLLASAVHGGDSPAPKELAQLQGTWKIVSFQANGVQQKPEKVQQLSMIFKDDKLIMKMPDGKSRKFDVKIDPQASPRTIDLTRVTPDKKTIVVLGIYKFDGNTCTLCINEGKSGRPKEFTSPANSSISVAVMQRKE